MLCFKLLDTIFFSVENLIQFSSIQFSCLTENKAQLDFLACMCKSLFHTKISAADKPCNTNSNKQDQRGILKSVRQVFFLILNWKVLSHE